MRAWSEVPRLRFESKVAQTASTVSFLWETSVSPHRSLWVCTEDAGRPSCRQTRVSVADIDGGLLQVIGATTGKSFCFHTLLFIAPITGT